MESCEEMVTPRAAAWEADEEERKAAAAEVLVECAAEADGAGSMVGKGICLYAWGRCKRSGERRATVMCCGK